MRATDWLALIDTALLLLVTVAVFTGRHWLQARIERGVQHTFDERIEAIRSDLRASEERLKSDLREKESEISALRDNVLSGRAARQAIVDRRRLDAIERVWMRVSTTLAPYKSLAGFMSVLNYEAIARRAATDQKIRQFVEMIINPISEDEHAKNSVALEQLFLSKTAGAYYSVYQLILFAGYARAKVVTLGVSDPTAVLDLTTMKNMLKTALPHRSEYVDCKSVGAYYYLLDELEGCILRELRLMLEGADVDQAGLQQSVAIMNSVKEAEKTLQSANSAAQAEQGGIKL